MFCSKSHQNLALSYKSWDSHDFGGQLRESSCRLCLAGWFCSAPCAFPPPGWVNVSGYAALMLLPGAQHSKYFSSHKTCCTYHCSLAKVSIMALPKVKKQEHILNPFNWRNDKHTWQISWIVVRVKIWGHKENLLLSKDSPPARMWHNAQSFSHFQHLAMSLLALDNFFYLFCIYWDGHMIFTFHSVNVINHSYWTACVGPSLHPRDEYHLTMWYDPFCAIKFIFIHFAEDICISFQQFLKILAIFWKF